MDDDDTVDLTNQALSDAANRVRPELDSDDAFVSLLSPGAEDVEMGSLEEEGWIDGASLVEHTDKRPRVDDEDGQRSGSVSPISEALQRYIASRRPDPMEPDPVVFPPRTAFQIPSPPSSPLLHEPTPLKGASTSQNRPVERGLGRRVAFRGDEEIIIEMSQETETSPIAAALFRRLDEMKKERAPFSCDVHLKSRLPGRRYVSWLKRVTRMRGATRHEAVPYRLVFLEAEEFVEEIGKDCLHSLLTESAKTAAGSKLGLIIIGLDRFYQAKRQDSIPYTRQCLETWLLELFAKHAGFGYHLVESCGEAAEHILCMTQGFLRILRTKHDPSFLMIFGGYESTRGIGKADLKLLKETSDSEKSAQKLIEWIRVLQAIPGIGAKAAHGIALVYPAFSHLMDIYCSTDKSEEEKKLLVADLVVPPRNVKRVGEAVSIALYRFFCNDQPDSCF